MYYGDINSRREARNMDHVSSPSPALQIDAFMADVNAAPIHIVTEVMNDQRRLHQECCCNSCGINH